MHGIAETVQYDRCVGCGVCNVATRGAIPITLSPRGLYKADLTGVNGSDIERGNRVCPFSDFAKNEDALGSPLQSEGDLPRHPVVGPYLRTAAGRVRDDEYLTGSSSGGLTSWVVTQLLETGEIDAVVHVGRGKEAELFEYTISRTVDDYVSQRKSQYYSTTLAGALTELRDTDLNCAIIGVPCFIKAARLLAQEDEAIGQRLKFFIALVCGHLKTQQFAEALGWQAGVRPEKLATVDFRRKNPERRSSDYDFAATASSGDVAVVPRRPLVGGNWGHGAFQPNACNFCDDIFGETADAVFGDAWLPQYEADWRGTNVLVNRSTTIDAILEKGVTDGSIELDSLSLDDVIATQAGNVRHRRDGLAVRLSDDIKSGKPVPRKRVEPDRSRVGLQRRILIRHRRSMSVKSAELFTKAKAESDLSIFLNGMRRAMRRYQTIDRLSPKKIRSRVRKLLSRL